MWNKLTHLVKHRHTDAQDDPNNAQDDPHHTPDASNASAATNGSVMSRVYEQHPNLSVFHSSSGVNIASPSPPASPSKGSKRSMFKRSLKAKLTSTPVAPANAGVQEEMLSPASSVWTSPSPVKLIPKKLRASLQIDTFTARSSNAAPVPESAPLPMQPHTPIIAEQHRNPAHTPSSDAQPTGTGSIRSILRDRNTPGTGQSVRFFSRDAYRVISPNISETDLGDEAIYGMGPGVFLEKLRSVSPNHSAAESNGNATNYHSAPTSPDNVVDMFSPPRPALSSKSRKPLPFQPRHPPRPRNTSSGSSNSSHSRSGSMSASNSQSQSSLMMPVLPPDMSNLFDISQEHELADIPVSMEGSLLDDAIEEVEESEEKMPNVSGNTSMQTIRRTSEHAPYPSSYGTPTHGRSVEPPRTILSPEGTVFHSVAGSTPGEGRTIFHSFTNAGDDRTSATMFFTPDISNAKINSNTAFFTPQVPPTLPTAAESSALVPVSNQAVVIPPPASSQEIVIHSQEDLVASLREQLVLQQQLATQYETDIVARDELVSLLTVQLGTAEAGAEKYRKEVERRQSAMRVLRRKVGELEKICRGLEDEVERSREESFERSVMDEASEDALVVLQGSIGQLKGELERTREDGAKVREERDALRSEIEAIAGERERRDEVESDLRAEVESKSETIRQLKAEVNAATRDDSKDQEAIDELQAELLRKEEAIHGERERYALAESAWAGEKAEFTTRLEARRSSQEIRETDLDDLRRMLGEKEEEVKVLKAEVEAQWGHAERADEKIKGLEGEKEALSKSVQALDAKVDELGSEWKEGEVRKAELEDELNEAWAAKEEVERERDQLVEDVNFEREHAERLTQTLQERESKLDEIEQERGYAVDNIARLEELLRTRNAETAEAQVRIAEREQEAEQLRAQMSKMKREHSRLVDEQGRQLDEIVQREETARMEMEDMVRQKAEDEVALGSMKERLGILTDEVERLRRQVHDLQQESADKEVKLLQLTKARVQDKEDKEGLNIALDSKQQELELLKRKLGLKGTGGSTPAPNRVALPDLASRRQSVAFATPSAPRQRPSSVVGLAKPTTVTETPSKTGLSSSLRSNAASSSAAPPSAMKPARTGSMGPPSQKRTSVSGAPLSSSTSSLARSTSSSKPRSALPVSNHRRSSSVMSSGRTAASPAPSEDGEKENAPPAKAARRTMVPA